MKEQFVLITVALALKEKGFDEKCLTFYWTDGMFCEGYAPFNYNKYNEISAPLWQQAFEWILQKLEEKNSESYNRRWSYSLRSDNTGFWDYGNGDACYEFNSKEEGILLGLKLI